MDRRTVAGPEFKMELGPTLALPERVRFATGARLADLILEWSEKCLFGGKPGQLPKHVSAHHLSSQSVGLTPLQGRSILAVPLDGPAPSEAARHNVGERSGEPLTRLRGAGSWSHGLASA